MLFTLSSVVAQSPIADYSFNGIANYVWGYYKFLGCDVEEDILLLANAQLKPVSNPS